MENLITKFLSIPIKIISCAMTVNIFILCTILRYYYFLLYCYIILLQILCYVIGIGGLKFMACGSLCLPVMSLVGNWKSLRKYLMIQLKISRKMYINLLQYTTCCLSILLINKLFYKCQVIFQ